MTGSNKIFLISDDKRASESLLSKINLLRDTDIVQSSIHVQAIEKMERDIPELIIVYADAYTKWSLGIIESIKLKPRLNKVPILLVCETIQQEFMLSAFDAGITDYTTIDVSESELLIRIIWCIQKGNLVKRCEQNLEQLVELGVVSRETYFYNADYVDKIFQQYIKKLLDDKKNVSFLILSPAIDSKYKLSSILLGAILKKTVRNSDIVGLKDEKFYILLPNTKIEGVKGLLSRIEEELTDEYKICAGALQLTDTNFLNAEKAIKGALQDALLQKETLIVASNEKFKTVSNWLDSTSMDMPHKNFKLFKQSFIKKFNSVISPTFFQMQKNYEEKLFNTQIEQVCNEDICVFKLISESTVGTFSVSYPGFSKINIDMQIIHNNKTNSQLTSLSLSELDAETLYKVLENFILKFKNIIEI